MKLCPVEQIAQLLTARGWTIATAESCTAGGIGQALTAVDGSSNWYEFGFITYSNVAKQQLLNVDSSIFDKYGAVSEQCVKAMARGALAVANANIAVSISGIAGPSGGTSSKPVGTVYVGLAMQSNHAIELMAEHHCFDGGRAAVRQQSIEAALKMVAEQLIGR